MDGLLDARVCGYKEKNWYLLFTMKIMIRTHLKNVDKGSWQGADRRKSGAYTIVCEHFDVICNAAMGA